MDRASSASADRIAALEAENARLEAELARLRESERMYRSSAELAARLVWAADADGGMVFLDYPFVALTGISAEEGLATGWYGVLHPDDREPTEVLWRRCWRPARPIWPNLGAPRRRELPVTRSRERAVRGEDGRFAAGTAPPRILRTSSHRGGSARGGGAAARSEEMHRSPSR